MDHPQLPLLSALNLGEKGLSRQWWVRRILGKWNTWSQGELWVALQGRANTGQFLLYAIEGVLHGENACGDRGILRNNKEQATTLTQLVALLQISLLLPGKMLMTVTSTSFLYVYMCVSSHICWAGLCVCSRVQVLDASIKLKQFQLRGAELK